MWKSESREPGAGDSGLQRISLIGGVLPWLAVLAVTLSGFYVRIAFGRWPRVYRDSPDIPLVSAAAAVAVIGALSWPAMVGVAALLPMARLAFRARPVFNRWVLSSVLGAVVLCSLSTTDPYGFLEWAFD
jgi:hypothetical protein